MQREALVRERDERRMLYGVNPGRQAAGRGARGPGTAPPTLDYLNAAESGATTHRRDGEADGSPADDKNVGLWIERDRSGIEHTQRVLVEELVPDRPHGPE